MYPKSIKLFNTFSIVLMLDSTNKFNKYPLSLLEFVGVTSTELTFSIAFAYMMRRKITSLGLLRDVVICCIPKIFHAKIVVTDRDNTLINVVDIGFLLCSVGITLEEMLKQNVRRIAKLKISKDEMEKRSSQVKW